MSATFFIVFEMITLSTEILAQGIVCFSNSFKSDLRPPTSRKTHQRFSYDTILKIHDIGRSRAMDVQSASENRKVWQGTFILAVAGIITKILSVGYRVPFQNIVGDIGFYIYQQVYPFYGISLVLSTYGFPVVISKILVERIEQHDQAGAIKILYISFFFLIVFGFSAFSILYFGADKLAWIMGDPKLVLLLKIIAFTFLLLPFISVLRGFHQGQKNMIPTAVSQVAEQLVRVSTILFFSFILLMSGYDTYDIGAGAIFGSITGGLTAVLVLLFYGQRKSSINMKNAGKSISIRTTSIVKALMSQSFAVCTTGLLLILIQLVDSLSLYSLLTSSGIDEIVAKKAKGIYDRGQPLIQLGTVLGTSFSLSLVPLISSAKARKDHVFIQKKVNVSLKTSFVVGIGSAFGLASIIEPTNRMLFEDTLGSNVLMILGFSIFFTTLSLTIAAILQGLGYFKFPAVIVFVGMLVKWLLNVALIPKLGTVGAAVATVVSFCIITVLLFFFLLSKMECSVLKYSIIRSAIFAAISMTVVIFSYLMVIQRLFSSFESSRIFATVQALSAVLLGGVVYILIILNRRVFSDEDLTLLPLGDKLTRNK